MISGERHAERYRFDGGARVSMGSMGQAFAGSGASFDSDVSEEPSYVGEVNLPHADKYLCWVRCPKRRLTYTDVSFFAFYGRILLFHRRRNQGPILKKERNKQKPQ